ncbi:tetratricopeptide repeat protein [Paraburkholderia sp. SIMBA_027]|uniref:tetratricopeptide repeat protein n=1 Tax=Paraburkholderia sp. SIMBA_027 TaxID=3085770 RepID=UPI0039797963
MSRIALRGWPRVAVSIAGFLFALNAFPSTTAIVVENIGTFEYSAAGKGLAITFESAATHKRLNYRVQPFDECSAMGMYRLPGTAQIAVDGSCQSQGGQVFIQIFGWNAGAQDWCMVRQISGEKPDMTSGDFVGSMEVARVLNCPKIGSDMSYTYESNESVKKDIDKKLAELKSAESDKAKLTTYLAGITFYDPLEIAGFVGKIDVQMANDLGFFLVQAKRPGDAIPLLAKIVSVYPDRVVAKLNLADALWNTDQQEPAKLQYSEYVSQMKKLGKSDRVPTRALERSH